MTNESKSAVSSIEPRLAELLRDLYVAIGQCMAAEDGGEDISLVYEAWHKRLEPFVLGKAAPSATQPTKDEREPYEKYLMGGCTETECRLCRTMPALRRNSGYRHAGIPDYECPEQFD